MNNPVMSPNDLIISFQKNPRSVKQDIEELLQEEIESDQRFDGARLSLYRKVFEWTESYELVYTADVFVNERVGGSLVVNSRNELNAFLQGDDALLPSDLDFCPSDFEFSYEDLEYSEFYVKISGLRLRTLN
jgi:hypothetical protein